MKTLCKGRGKGKTTDAIRYAAEKDGIIVVRDEKRRKHVLYIASRILKRKVDVLTIHEVLMGYTSGQHDRELIIDDADTVLLYVLSSVGCSNRVGLMTFPKRRPL